MRCAAFLLLVAPCFAQGVLPLSASYRFGSLLAEYGGNCSPPNPTVPEVDVGRGEIAFSADGRYSYTENEYVVCPGGQTSTSQNSGAGTYFVGDGGWLLLDEGQPPGIDTFLLFLRSDTGNAAAARQACEDTSAELIVAVALGSGHSNASLSGNYHVARLSLRSSTSFLAVGDFGRMTFDGSGSYSENGTRRTVPLGGSVTTAPYSGNGTYGIAADGALTARANGWGAVSSDREMFFWITTNGPDVDLTIGVRAGAAYGNGLANGAWGTSMLAADIGSAAAFPGALATEHGALRLTSTGGRTFDWDSARIESRPQFAPNECDEVSRGGGWSLPSTGVLTLTPRSGAPLDVGLSADGSNFVGVTAESGSVGLIFGVAGCSWPRRFGRPTAGSGNMAPTLASVGGFPHVGNTGFGLLVTGGLGGAPGAALTSLGASNGIPLLGGTVWIDPVQVVLQFPMALSGPANLPGVGAGAVFLPLPTSPAVAGLQLYAQALFVDGGAPAGVSMTQGLQVDVSR
ncbi:MAG: hypothetical protein R3F56_24330 [Planctomycetota bacterium]